MANKRRQYESDQRSRAARRASTWDDDAEIDDAEIAVEDAAAYARNHIAKVTGKQPGTVISVDPAEAGWLVEVELVEQERIPTSLDVLAVYAVELDGGGGLLAYRRNRRYSRANSMNGTRE